MYHDLLTRIKNAQAVKAERIKAPYNKMDEAIADLLVGHKYLESAAKKGRNPKRVLEIELKYDGGKAAVRGFKFFSKPSRRLYVGYKDIKSVKQGYGMAVLSTSNGIMSGSEARKQKVGGEFLFEIW
ncbi:MAG: 30S ribosomal protein S8 [Parcubacteria group bacterium]|nr:30S ribosomal protein S8 [Parcubacteria group bacterium]